MRYMGAESRSLRHEAVTGLVVAGGKSSRFGSDKASAVVAGRALLEWVMRGLTPACEAFVVVRARGQVLPPVEVEPPIFVVDDAYDEKGPLAGLVAGMGAVRTPLAFAASCDVPLIESSLVSGLALLAEGYDVVVPHVDGFPQPLLAIYRPSTCLDLFREAVDHDRLKITAAYSGLRVRVVREPEVRTMDPALVSFRNLNRVDDLAEVERLLSERA